MISPEEDEMKRHMSHYEEVIHPNLEKHDGDEDEEGKVRLESVLDGAIRQAEPGSFYTSALVKWFVKYDEAKLKPFLIRNYDRLRAIVEDKYQE